VRLGSNPRAATTFVIERSARVSRLASHRSIRGRAFARPLDDERSSSTEGWDSRRSFKGTGFSTGRRANAIHRTVCTERIEALSRKWN